MINVLSKRSITLIFMIFVLTIIVFLTLSRQEYKVSDNIPEKIVIETGHSIYDGSGHYIINDVKYFLLDLNTGIFTNYTGNYNASIILKDSTSYDNMIYSQDNQFYINKNHLYNTRDGLINTNMWESPMYRYWTKDNKYLILLSHAYVTKFWIKFPLWQLSVKIMDLKLWKVQQINFKDIADSWRWIIDIIGIVN